MLRRQRSEVKTTAVFGYGSNGIAQLRERCQNQRLEAVAATLPNYVLCFAGMSRKWGGGVASVIYSTGRTVYGSVVYLTEDELELLDGFEGVNRADPFSASGGTYRRAKMTCVLKKDGSKVPGIMYLKNNLEWRQPPSEAYLEACLTHIGGMWPERPRTIDVYDSQGKRKSVFDPRGQRAAAQAPAPAPSAHIQYNGHVTRPANQAATSRPASAVVVSRSAAAARHRIFTYGSMLTGLHNHRVIEHCERLAPKARTEEPFVLLDPHLGFPYACKRRDVPSLQHFASPLYGEVYAVDDLTLADLDAMETGAGYSRERISIVGAGVGAGDTWAYLQVSGGELAKARRGVFTPVPHGDWKAYKTGGPHKAGGPHAQSRPASSPQATNGWQASQQQQAGGQQQQQQHARVLVEVEAPRDHYTVVDTAPRPAVEHRNERSNPIVRAAAGVAGVAGAACGVATRCVGGVRDTVSGAAGAAFQQAAGGGAHARADGRPAAEEEVPAATAARQQRSDSRFAYDDDGDAKMSSPATSPASRPPRAAGGGGGGGGGAVSDYPTRMTVRLHKEDGELGFRLVESSRRIAHLVPNGPAERAKLQVGDTLVSVDGVVVQPDVPSKVYMPAAYKKFDLTFERGSGSSASSSC